MKQIKGVKALKDFCLKVIWDNNETSEVSLVDLIDRSKHFNRFLDHPNEFTKVSLVEQGGGVEWENGLDYSASSLWSLKELQSPI